MNAVAKLHDELTRVAKISTKDGKLRIEAMPGAVPHALVVKARRYKEALIRYIEQQARLSVLAGNRWPEIANEDHGDDALLAELPDETMRVYAAVCADRLLREQGIVPASHTEQAHCPKCGPVFVLPGCNTSKGCPWCSVSRSTMAKRHSLELQNRWRASG